MKNLANTQRFELFTTNLFRKRCFFSQLKLFCDNFYKKRNVPRIMQTPLKLRVFRLRRSKSIAFFALHAILRLVFLLYHTTKWHSIVCKKMSRRFSLANYAASFWNCVALRKKIASRVFQKGWHVAFAFGAFIARTLFYDCKHCVRIVKLLC